MGLILDTSVLIEAERGTFDMEGLLESVGDEPVALAAISASELLHGVERAPDRAIRAKRQDYVERVLNDLPVLAFGLREAREHARVWAMLASRGIAIGAHDLLVAATVIATVGSLATLNEKDFRRVPGMALVPTAPFLRRRQR